MKALVLYYSNSYHTSQVMGQIAKRLNAPMEAIRVKEPYGDSLMARSKQEAEVGPLPEILPLSKDFSEYDSLFLGTPVWWLTASTPVQSFLAENDLHGKNVYPVITTGFDVRGVLEKFSALIEKAGGKVGKALIVPFENAMIRLDKAQIDQYVDSLSLE